MPQATRPPPVYAEYGKHHFWGLARSEVVVARHHSGYVSAHTTSVLRRLPDGPNSNDVPHLYNWQKNRIADAAISAGYANFPYDDPDGCTTAELADNSSFLVVAALRAWPCFLDMDDEKEKPFALRVMRHWLKHRARAERTDFHADDVEHSGTGAENDQAQGTLYRETVWRAPPELQAVSRADRNAAAAAAKASTRRYSRIAHDAISSTTSTAITLDMAPEPQIPYPELPDGSGPRTIDTPTQDGMHPEVGSSSNSIGGRGGSKGRREPVDRRVWAVARCFHGLQEGQYYRKLDSRLHDGQLMVKVYNLEDDDAMNGDKRAQVKTMWVLDDCLKLSE